MDYHLEDFRALGSTKPILDSLRLSKKSPTQECCGLFVFENNKTEYTFLSFNNEKLLEKDLFSMNNSEFLKHYLSGNILSLFHSHIDYDENPSSLDIDIAESLGIPSYIFSLSTNESFLYYPSSFKPEPLESRIFIPFFQDCISFVKDYYYFSLGIKLNLYIKNWARKRIDSNDYLINNIKKYFFEININDAQNGDIAIFKPSFNNLFHIGVFDKKQYIYHHKIMHYPTHDLFTEELRNQVYKVYRYKGL
jgi:proteasome lid subunit RPN8/RPN11